MGVKMAGKRALSWDAWEGRDGGVEGEEAFLKHCLSPLEVYEKAFKLGGDEDKTIDKIERWFSCMTVLGKGDLSWGSEVWSSVEGKEGVV